MSCRIYSTDLIAGACVVGDRGGGVLGSLIPATGERGPAYIYNDLSLPADANKEYMGRIITPPPDGTFFAFEDTSYTLTGATPGVKSFTYQLYEDYVAIGSPVTSYIYNDFTTTATVAALGLVQGTVSASTSNGAAVTASVTGVVLGSASATATVQTIVNATAQVIGQVLGLAAANATAQPLANVSANVLGNVFGTATAFVTAPGGVTAQVNATGQVLGTAEASFTTPELRTITVAALGQVLGVVQANINVTGGNVQVPDFLSPARTYRVPEDLAKQLYTISQTAPVWVKDPSAVLDYTVDWTLPIRESEDVIDSATVIPDTGLLSLVVKVVEGTKVAAMLAGADTGLFSVVYRIVTRGGRTDERTIQIQVTER